MGEAQYPRMIRVRQEFDAPRLDDVAGEVRQQIEQLSLDEKIQAGQSVAITAGSRGIANIAVIVKAIAESVRELGGNPFIVPAMGSHGGATAEGQQKVLRSYGISEEQLGVEVRATMDTVVVDHISQGIPVHFDRYAWEADHVIVCGRVKPHTGFVGPIESGLHKMMLIGLGNHAGAKIYHQAIADYSFLEIIRAVGDSVIRNCGVLCGIAIVENALDQTGRIEAVLPENFFERESALLETARQWMPGLPFSEVDLLIIDRIGKNISGTGMDTNVVGRKYNDHAATDKDDVSCRRILIRGLTDDTYGNATGIGLAEFTTRQCVESINMEATRVNSLTGNHPTGAMIPVTFDTDAEAISAALQTIGLRPVEQARVIQIADTLHLSECLVSEHFSSQIEERSDLSVVAGPAPMAIDASGCLQPV